MALPARIVVLVNARAHRSRKDRGLAERLRGIAGETGRVLVTHAPDEVPGALESVGPLDEAIVALCGGDGAVMFGLTALGAICGQDALPRVALLPAGTVNTVARTVGVRGGPEEVLAGLVRRLRRGEPLHTRGHVSLVANDRIGFIFGAGLVSSFFSKYNDVAAAGRVWAAVQIGRIFVGSFVGSSFARQIMAPVPARLTVDGVPSALSRITLLLASTFVDVGLGLKVTYRAAEAGDGFHIVGTGLPATLLGPQLPLVLLGRRLHAEPQVDAIAHEVDLELPEGSKTLLDGELFPGASVHLRAGPRVQFVW